MVLNRIVIGSAVTKLPKELRKVVILYYFQELKLTEIANILCIGLPLTKYRFGNEITSIILCLVCSAIWWPVTMTEKIYTIIIQPVWICLFTRCILFLVIVIYKTVYSILFIITTLYFSFLCDNIAI